MIATEVASDQVLKCYHCGETCQEILWLENKPFCCYGCKTVYEILCTHDLCEYYTFDQNPGLHVAETNSGRFLYLDEVEIRKKLLSFDSENLAKVSLNVPGIHCISCIWLLENLHKIEPGVLRVEVNFGQKKISVDFDPSKVRLSKVAHILSSLGYAPQISLDAERAQKLKPDRTLLLQVAIAGFCFGNIMLFSFPEYLGIEHSERNLTRLFAWLNLVLSIPVFFYSGWGYITAAAKSFKQRQINIDVPIAAGLIALFLRSSYDIITASGPGYLDSFTGLVFFLLVGRWFQSKTYESLAFNRDFTAYFPLAVNKLVKDEWKPVVIHHLRRQDIIQVRNMEIIPADSTLLEEVAYIDYSFVTGESRPVKVRQNELVYAGGRLVGAPAKLVVKKETSQSHLTSLWNNDAFKKVDENKFQKIIDRAARAFTWVVLVIAVGTGVYWQVTDPSQMWVVLTSVLMVACPCALALAAPFTFGSMLRVFGRNRLYLKNADVIERMATIDAIVFDKTGTVTHGDQPTVSVYGTLSNDQLAAVKTLTGYSTHPLSRLLTKSIANSQPLKVRDFKEVPGEGIEGVCDGDHYRIGSAAFTGGDDAGDQGTKVFVAVNGKRLATFSIKTAVRANLRDMMHRLAKKCVALISGDRETDRLEMQNVFPLHTAFLFQQTPEDKLVYIRTLQRRGRKVLMVGDGLNDAGALKQSDVGIAVTDDTGLFTPASDGILYGSSLPMLDRLLELAKSSSVIVKTGFAISFFYNGIALSFAISGHLTPLVAAILMPISSITVVGFTTLAVNFTAKTKLGT